MPTTIGSLDLNAFSDLHSDLTLFFWFEPNASATYGAGAHVTLVPDTSFISNPTGQNILINTDGFSIRNGLLPMMTLDNNSLNFNVVDTTDGTYTTTATFTDTGAQIGQTGGAHIQISSSGLDVNLNSSTNIANFGTNGARIGQTGESRLEIDYHSMQLVDKEGSTYFHVSDLRNEDGTYTDTFTGNGTKVEFDVRFASSTPANEIVTVNGVVITSGYTFSAPYSLRFSNAPQSGAIITITYNLEQGETLKAYTIGKRGSNKYYGRFSLAEGYENDATGDYSHAEGYQVLSVGGMSHAEGDSTETRARASHAEGYKTKAHGNYSHAEGYYSKTIGAGSHAQNWNTLASSDYQTSIGKYNVSDDSDTYAFIIGNGTADDARSNALTVDWSGNVELAGTVKNLIVTDQKSTTLSLPASNTATASINMAKTGYTLLGIVGVQPTGSGSSLGYIYGFHVSGNTAYVNFRNTTATARSFTVIVTGLYVKS